MDVIATTGEAAKLLKANRQTIARRCAAGKYAHAFKDGGRWLINLTRQYPELFGKIDGRDVWAHAATNDKAPTEGTK